MAVVLVGDRTDSGTYVRMKKRACDEVGIDQSQSINLPEDVSQEELIRTVRDLDANPDVHGILVQLPLPSGIDEAAVLSQISAEKDVDGLDPRNVGRLALRGRTPAFVPCTPRGCMELLRRYNISVEGKHAVVLGRSNIVGIPMGMLLLQANATVTTCHSRTVDIADHVRRADILVAAIGQADFVKKEWLKPGCVVIDVGMNAVDAPDTKKGYRLTGDVDLEGAKEVVSAYTPVPGGVGPMTIAMLLSNTVTAGRAAMER